MFSLMFCLWLCSLAISLLFPILLIPIGRTLEKAPSKEVNKFIGYRTSMSMKNAETWVFAQKYWGRKVFFFSLLALPLAVVLMLFALNASIVFMVFYGVAVMAIVLAFVLIPSILLTEKALKANFRQDGARKEI